MVYTLGVHMSYYVISSWLTAILIASLCLVISIGSRKYSSRAFVFSLFWVTLWTIGTGFLISAPNYAISIFLNKFSYVLSSTVATSFLYFFLTYPDDKKPKLHITVSLVIIQIIIGYIILSTNLIVGGAFPLSSPAGWGWNFGPLSFIYDAVFVGFFLTGLVVLYNKYQRQNNSNTKKNLLFMMFAVGFGTIPPFIVCNILPHFNFFDLDWLGSVTGCIWVFIIAYSIAKYHQMDVRVAATKVFVIAMVMMALLNIFIDVVFGIYGRIILFVIFAILGYILFRSLTAESEHRDQLSLLNTTLSQKVAEQTAEIRKAYELEKHARRELEKLNETKDQFIMLTQHHLRAPVTRIRTGIDAALSGDHGRVSAKLRTSLLETNTSVARLTKIVDDFLEITTLKAGGQMLDIETGNLLKPLEEVLEELRLDAEKMRLSINYPPLLSDWPSVPMDESKMREALLIIIENAVRYNVQDGRIDISNKVIDDKVLEITIENTGVGMTSADAPKLFHQHYFRSKEALAANPIGMGIGLGVARAVVRAHHGELTIESDGEGKGARVRISMQLR